jgi:hypothetical protein
MPSFFDKPFSEQVKIAIDCSDPKFLQLLLGIKHCQLQEDWVAHVILSHKVIGVIHTLKYQLPINIMSAQQQVLDKNFANFIYDVLPNIHNVAQPDNLHHEINVNNDIAVRVNQELADIEKEILKTYKSFKHKVVDDQYQVFNVRDMIDANKCVYSYDGDNYTGGNIYLEDITELFKSKLTLQPVLKLDVSSHYNQLYDEMYEKVIKQYRLRIRDGQSINSLYEGNESLIEKLKGLRDSDNRLRSMLSSITKEIVSGIQSGKFIQAVHYQLIDNVLRTALKENNHPLHKEFSSIEGTTEEKIEVIKKKVKEQVEANDQHRYKKEYMEYAANKNYPSIHIISVLIANGASLLASYVTDHKTRQSITVKERLQQLGKEYQSLIGKSIFTITRKVHDLVFDFPMVGKEEVDLLKLVSEIPSEDGYFVKNGERTGLLDKIGSEGANEFMDLLKACIGDVNAKKEVFTNVEKKEFEEAYERLYECIKVGYSAIKTRDDKVIVDYLSEIEEEAKQSKNPHLKKLYKKFFKILSEYNDLPKSLFLLQWLKYTLRTVKSYSGYEWSPAWEKILTGPGYRTDVGEWSKNKYEEIEKAEQEEERRISAVRIQAAEQKAIEEAEARQQAEEEKRVAEEEKRVAEEEKRVADKRAQLIKSNSKILTRKILNLDNEKLQDVVADKQDEIVEAVVNHVMEHSLPHEGILDAIMEKISLNKNLILSVRDPRDAINKTIKDGIRNFKNQGPSTSLESTDVYCASAERNLEESWVLMN